MQINFFIQIIISYFVVFEREKNNYTIKERKVFYFLGTIFLNLFIKFLNFIIMTTSKNFSEMLNELNSSLNLVSSISVYQKKYDYESLNIAKSLQKSFRVKFRKDCEKIYFGNSDLKQVENFISSVEKSLLVCTVEKKKFFQLTTSDIFNGYEKLSENDKKIVNEKHKLFCEICKPIETEKKK